MRTLVAVPVFNEIKTIRRVLPAIRERADEVLVVDDGSTDGTSEVLDQLAGPLGLHVLRHAANAGYGRSLQDAFQFGIDEGYDWLITMDMDEQHEPASIPEFVRMAERNDRDLISGSRYLTPLDDEDPLARPPEERRRINRTITAELNERLAGRLGQGITDAFCGFKAHRVASLRDLTIDEDGYAFPMQLWVQAAANNWRIGEAPVRLIYNDPNRSFGADLDDAARRLTHYRTVLHTELCRFADRLPASAAHSLIVDSAPCR